MGMGYAYSTVGGDVSVIYFNPATLALSPESSMSITYEITHQSNLTADDIFQPERLKLRNLIFIGFSSDKGAFSWRPLANDFKRVESGADWAETETKINAYTFSVTNKQENDVYSGLNISYLTGRIAQSQIVGAVPFTNISDGNGVSLDLGTVYKVSDEFALGLNLKNLCGFMWWDDYETDLLPFTMVAGLSFNISRFSVFAFDWEKRYYRKDGSDPVEMTHFGIEQSLGSILSFQFGIYGQDLSRQKAKTTAGLSYQKSGYMLSLAGEKYQLADADVNRYLFSLNIPMK